MLQEQFRKALEAGDVTLVRMMWAKFMPHTPQPGSAKDAELMMHYARTQSETISLRARAYSHRWLTERDIPSGLPNRLKMSAEQVCPRIATSVGISVNFRSPWMRPAEAEVRAAMEDVVNDCYANGDTEPVIIRPRMMEAKEKVMRSLFGRR